MCAPMDPVDPTRLSDLAVVMALIYFLQFKLWIKSSMYILIQKQKCACSVCQPFWPRGNFSQLHQHLAANLDTIWDLKDYKVENWRHSHDTWLRTTALRTLRPWHTKQVWKLLWLLLFLMMYFSKFNIDIKIAWIFNLFFEKYCKTSLFH